MPKPDSDSSCNPVSTPNTTERILSFLGVLKVVDLASGAIDSVTNEFYRITDKHFPETKGEWSRTELEISHQRRAIGMFEKCKRGSRRDCVSIYLAAVQKGYLDNSSTTAERDFIREYDTEKETATKAP